METPLVYLVISDLGKKKKKTIAYDKPDRWRIAEQEYKTFLHYK
jgi:hypothetical protein